MNLNQPIVEVTALRDTLSPKLLSGELSVAELGSKVIGVL